MNKRQAKKLYKKIHGCNPTEGRIPAVLLRNPGKAKKHTGKQISAQGFNTLEAIKLESTLPESVLKSVYGINEPKVNMNIMTQEEREKVTIVTRCLRRKINDSIRRINSCFKETREKIRGNGDPVVITTRRLSENRKKNKGTAWRRARRYR